MSFSTGVVNFLMSHHMTVPSVLAVKNSERVLLWIHMVLYTGSMWDTERLISPSGLPPFLSSHQQTWPL